jgi:hypothetical protein
MTSFARLASYAVYESPPEPLALAKVHPAQMTMGLCSCNAFGVGAHKLATVNIDGWGAIAVSHLGENVE